MQTYMLIRQTITHGVPVLICITAFLTAYSYNLQHWLKG